MACLRLNQVYNFLITFLYYCRSQIYDMIVSIMALGEV